MVVSAEARSNVSGSPLEMPDYGEGLMVLADILTQVDQSTARFAPPRVENIST